MSTADNCLSFAERVNALLHVTYIVSAELSNVTNVTRVIYVLSGEYIYVPKVMSNVLRVVSEMAKPKVDTVVLVGILKKRFLVGEMYYFMANSWRLRFGALSLRFWLKRNSFAMLTRVFHSQTSTRVHQILTSTHNHKVTPYSHTSTLLLHSSLFAHSHLHRQSSRHKSNVISTCNIICS